MKILLDNSLTNVSGVLSKQGFPLENVLTSNGLITWRSVNIDDQVITIESSVDWDFIMLINCNATTISLSTIAEDKLLKEEGGSLLKEEGGVILLEGRGISSEEFYIGDRTIIRNAWISGNFVIDSADEVKIKLSDGTIDGLSYFKIGHILIGKLTNHIDIKDVTEELETTDEQSQTLGNLSSDDERFNFLKYSVETVPVTRPKPLELEEVVRNRPGKCRAWFFNEECLPSYAIFGVMTSRRLSYQKFGSGDKIEESGTEIQSQSVQFEIEERIGDA